MEPAAIAFQGDQHLIDRFDAVDLRDRCADRMAASGAETGVAKAARDLFERECGTHVRTPRGVVAIWVIPDLAGTRLSLRARRGVRVITRFSVGAMPSARSCSG